VTVNAILSSFLLVAAAEMGDKTQLLALSLAARFRRPWTVMGGILLATLANHALAAGVGTWVSIHVPPRLLAAGLAALFITFGFWALIPDKASEEGRPTRLGPFLTSAVLFFLVEMGDKTQLATMALGARFQSVVLVTIGTTLGMMVADGLAVLLGDRLATRLQARWIRWVAAALFFAFGLAAAWSALVNR
jgi:putative Ca2+/H+ antiporter (TMEM165/GDT1 family)